MGKATQRRERRLAETLGELIQRDREAFLRLWDRHLGGWLQEIGTRGRAMHRTSTGSAATDVFGVMEKAQRLLVAVGAQAETLVGGRTRQLLAHEASKATAAVTDPHLYSLSRGAWRVGGKAPSSSPVVTSRKPTHAALQR